MYVCLLPLNSRQQHFYEISLIPCCIVIIDSFFLLIRLNREHPQINILTNQEAN